MMTKLETVCHEIYIQLLASTIFKGETLMLIFGGLEIKRNSPKNMLISSTSEELRPFAFKFSKMHFSTTTKSRPTKRDIGC